MTGSFISEYTGQFKTLGLGIGAPNPSSDTALHIKNTSGTGDPTAIIEGDGGNDNAAIRTKNTDAFYDFGIFGSSGDQFLIVQDRGLGSQKFPFSIDKGAASYLMYLAAENVGIGMGASTATRVAALPAGSLQAEATISGSLIEGNIISASSNVVNTVTIHGTASDAKYATAAASAGSVNLGSVVMTGANNANFSASGNFNSINNIVSNGGRVEGTILRYKTEIEDINGDDIIVGSADSVGGLKFGDIDGAGSGGGIFMNMKCNEGDTLFKNDSGNHSIFVDGNVTASLDMRISGSATPSLTVGPNTGIPGSNNPSASLYHDKLEFFKANDVYVGNYNTASGASLKLKARNVDVLNVSSSNQVEVQKTLIIKNQDTDSSDLNRETYLYGVNTFGANFHQRTLYEAQKINVAANSTGVLFTFTNARYGGTLGVLKVKASVLASTVSGGDGAYIENTTLFGTSGAVFIKRGTTQNTISVAGSGLTTSNVTATVAGGSNNQIQISFAAPSGNAMRVSGWIEIDFMSSAEAV